MVDVPERRSFITPARLLIGSVVLGGGIVALGLLFGGGSANAAEPPAPNPLGGVVASVDSVAAGVGDTAGAAVASVTPAAPVPVREIAAQVAQPVASAVGQVAEAAPVETVVSPVAQAADGAVAAPVEQVAPVVTTPASGAGASAPQTSAPRHALVSTLGASVALVTSALADHPVSAVTAPITATADGLLAGVAGAAVDAAQPLTVAGAAEPAGEQSAILSGDARPARGVSSPPASARAATALRAAAPPYVPASGTTPAANSALLGDASRGDSDAPSQGTPSGVMGTSASGGQAGGSGSGVAALGGNAASLLSALSLSAGLPADDDLPSSPVFDHDSSPD